MVHWEQQVRAHEALFNRCVEGSFHTHEVSI
jgi:hypothetical protein